MPPRWFHVSQAINAVRGSRKVENANAETTYEALAQYSIDLVGLAEAVRA